MEKFDMAKFLSDAGVNLDTGNREQIEYIPIDRIVPDPDNFYELSDLEDLAANIALLGLQQPIRVRPMQGGNSQFMIISGHRRHAALKLLIAQDGREDLRDVPCIVERSEENPKLTQLKLIYANASTRVLTSAEQAKQAEQVEKLLYELKEDGMEFPGRMRDHVAQACKMSTGKLARLKVIR
ncbi:MAG: ParB/RepB/Spo0J family partition protein, partial [Faecousia sp.]